MAAVCSAQSQIQEGKGDTLPFNVGDPEGGVTPDNERGSPLLQEAVTMDFI